MSFKTIDGDYLQSHYQDKFKGILVVDIRSADEYQREHIPGSINVPIDQLAQYDFSQHHCSSALFHCRSGQRTQMAKEQIEACGIEEVYCLQGGLQQWQQCGLPIAKHTKARLDIMRQVQLIAGVFIMLGVILALAVNPWWSLLSGFVGLGLFIAGATGTCALATLLCQCPWNRVSQQQSIGE